MDLARFCLLVAGLFCVVAGLSSGHSHESPVQIAAVPGKDAPSKFENGFQIFWRSTWVPGNPQLDGTDPEARVRIFENAHQQSVVFSVASAIRSFDPGFMGVSIYDVSARRPGFIAVAAVYSRSGRNPVGVLLYFDWNGALFRQAVLNGRREIRSLEIVSADQVWALNDFDPMDRSKFVFTAFDKNGVVVKEAVKSHRSWSTEESMSKGGQTSFGLTGDRVWAWLPRSRTFISFNSLTGRTEANRTGFPQVSGGSELYARQAAVLPQGQLLMDIGWKRHEKRNSGWFTWSAQSGWHEVYGAVNGRYLYGVEANQVIFSTPKEPSNPLPPFRSVSVNDVVAYTTSPRATH